MTTVDVTDRRAVDPATDPDSETWPRGKRIAFRTLVGMVAVAGLPLYVFGLAEVVLMWLSDARLLDLIDDLEGGDLRFRAQFFHLGIVAWALIPSLLVQLRKPNRRVAPALQGVSVAAVAAIVMLSAGAFEATDLGILVIFGCVAWLHPSAALLARRPRLDRMQLGVAGVGAVGWSVLAGSFMVSAWDERGLHGAGDVQAHQLWASSAVMAVALVIVSVVGATDHRSWQVPAATASLGGVLVGAHALAHPDQAASMGVAAAMLAVGWGMVYGAVSIRRMRRRTIA